MRKKIGSGVGLVRRVVQRRLLFSGLLSAVAGGLFVWATLWIWISSNHESTNREEIAVSENPMGDVRLTIQGLVARQVRESTVEPSIRAASAELSQNWGELFLERVSADAEEIPNAMFAGMPTGSTFSFEVSAGFGILDILDGNLVLAKDVRGTRSDGVRIHADRMEYEAGKSEIRFASAIFKSQGLENRSEMIVTDGRLQRIRLNERMDKHRSKHPFFIRNEENP